MKATLKLFISLTIIFTALIFTINSVNAAQNPNYPSPSQCNGADWNIGLPNGVTCSSSATTGGAMENDTAAVSVFGTPSRLKPDLTSLNKFCKQYTGDSTSFAIYGRMHNYCNYCDQNLSWWSGSSWVTNAVCGGTLNVQQVTCATGCGPICITHSTKQCSDNAVYWYNSCGVREDLFQTCTANQVCQNAQCVNVTCSTNADCGSNGYVGSSFCQDNNVYKNYRTYTCNNPGTTNSSCSQSIVPRLITNCTASQICTSGSCTNTNIGCSNNSDCGTNGYVGDAFCQGNSVYRNYRTYTCNNPGTTNSFCSNATNSHLIQTCGANQTCQSGSCINANIVCNLNSDCGINGYIGSPFCQGNNVYQNYITYTCNNPGTAQSYCINSTNAQLIQTCASNQLCSNGSCIQQNQNPIANAGPDKYVNSGQTVVLEGSGYDPDGGTINFYWSCNGGYLSNSNISQPLYTAPSVSQNTSYICFLTVTDNSGRSASDSAIVYVNAQQQNINVQTNTATNISNNQATLNGYLYGLSAYSPIYVWFQWGQTTSYGYETNRQTLTYSGSFNQNIAGLVPNTLYHFRAVAQASTGALVYGQDMTFLTGTSSVSGNLLTINKTARNLSSGNLNWSNVVNASPSDVLQFMVTIQAAGSGNVNDITVREAFPANLIYKNSLTIDNVADNRDIRSGINIGSLSPGQTKIIIYQAQIAPKENFTYGTTTLNNSVSVLSSQAGFNAVTATSTIIVTKTGILGATAISTGFTNNFFVDSFFLPLLIAGLAVWLFRTGIIRFQEWVDLRKVKHKDYLAQKQLKAKIAKIREKEGL